MVYEPSKETMLERDLSWGFTAEESEKRWEKHQQRKERERIVQEKQNKIISTLLQQCADEGLTYDETLDTAHKAVSRIDIILSDMLLNFRQSRVEV